MLLYFLIQTLKLNQPWHTLDRKQLQMLKYYLYLYPKSVKNGILFMEDDILN